jgi:membrane protease YdiL (CAAX protease family)
LQLVRLTIFTLVTWAPPLRFLIRSKPGRQRAPQALARVLAVLVVATIAAVATAPAGVTGPFRLPVPFALLIPATTWTLLLYEWRQAPPAARALGFVLGDWYYYALAGAAAGVALGFHMLLITHYLPSAPTVHRATPAEFLWLVCYVVGLRATGEELLFRGLGYHLLGGSSRPIPAVVAQIAGLNLLIYLMPLSQSMNPALWLLSLVYGAVLAVATTLLRYRAGSLIPSLACNATFTLFVAAVLPW